MEAMEAKQRRSGHTLETDPSMRRPRPGNSSTSERKALNGASVPSRTNFITHNKAGTSAKARRGSDDEIDSLSSQAADSDDEERTRVTRVRPKKQDSALVDVKGKMIPAHPSFPPDKKALPSFKKKKAEPLDSSQTVVPSDSSSLSHSASSALSGPVNLAALKDNENGKLPRTASTHSQPNSTHSSNETTLSAKKTLTSRSGSNKPSISSFPSLSPLRSGSPSPIFAPEETARTKLAFCSKTPKPSSSMLATRGSNASKRTSPVQRHPSSSSVDVIATKSKKKGKARADTKAAAHVDEPQARRAAKGRSPSPPSRTRRKQRPLDSDPDSGTDSHGNLFGSAGDEPTPKPNRIRLRNRDTSSIAPFSDARPTPVVDLTMSEIPSPSSSKPKPRTKRKKTAPDLRPLSRSGSQLDLEHESDGANSTPRKKGASFPMLSPLSSPADETSRRNRMAPFPMLIPLPKHSSDDEDTDGITAAPIWQELSESKSTAASSAPDAICPYCDAPMPSTEERTQQLTNLLLAAEKRSQPAPRPDHPFARRAPVSVHGAVCERHDFEMKELPRARARGWPTKINWGALRARIERLQPKMARLIQGDEEARRTSIYWRSVEEDVLKSGTRAVAGVKGQFESFDKVQPGYYGERGAHMIFQIVHNLFPSFDANALGALTPDIVLQRVLVPEVALALVIDDMGVDAQAASRILKESARYGAMMYPLHDDDQDQRDIGHGMVRERARARARVIATEERVEDEMLQEEKEKEKRRKREISLSDTGSEEGGRRARSPKSKRRKPALDISLSSDELLPTTNAVLPRPRAPSRTLDPDSDTSITSAKSTRSTRSKGGVTLRRNAGADDDDIEVLDQALPVRRKPQRSTRRAVSVASSDSGAGSEVECLTEMDATPKPPAHKGKREQASASSEHSNVNWSRSQRDPLDRISPFEKQVEKPHARDRRIAGKSTQASNSWLLSDPSQ